MATPEVISAYGGVPALPTTFIIDTQGRVVGKHAGLHPMDTYVLEFARFSDFRSRLALRPSRTQANYFLKNAVNATGIARSKFTGLTPAQKKAALHRLKRRELHLRMHLDSLPMPCK